MPNDRTQLRIGDLPETGGRMNTEWMEQAACKGYPIEWFYPDTAGMAAHSMTNRAKELCADCPVLQQCHDWANATNEPHGLWAGQLRNGRPRTAIPCGSEAGAKAHRRRGESPCGSCAHAARVASKVRKADDKARRAS